MNEIRWMDNSDRSTDDGHIGYYSMSLRTNMNMVLD